MIISDMHCDSLLTVNSERGLINGYNTSAKHPFLQFFAGFVPCEARPPEVRRRELMHYFDIYAYECDRLGLTKIEDVRGLCTALDMNEKCAMFTVEGGGGLLADSEELFTLHRAGLRVMSLVWDSNELGTSSADELDIGLTPEGIRMAKRCAELGITVDVSHLSDKSFYELCESYPLPIIATHSNFRDICPHHRNLTLDMARIIVARGGVIGLNLYPLFVNRPEARITDLLRHLDYGLEHLGESAIGFGFDIDGTYGLYPEGIDESASIHDKICDMLLSRYPASTVERIAGTNVTDFLKGVL